jgi:tetratricopeptide (TPR) repeat protein
VTRIRILSLLAAAGAAATVALLGGVLAGSGSNENASATQHLTVERLATGFASSNTVAYVLQLQDALRATPNDVRGLGRLGLAYQQRARETGDPAYYTKAKGVLLRALRLAPRDLIATGALGSLALSQHRFREALALGLRARRLSPTTARTYGVIGDALVELGRYREAFAAFDTMARLRPSLAAYARVSYARELLGDFEGAVSAMRLAQSAAIGRPEAIAWTKVQLGKLYWSHGMTRAAAREYGDALHAFRGYVYAYDALAQVEAARGRLRQAILLEQRAVDEIPLPQFVALLGDLEHRAGDATAAQRQYATIGVIQRLLVANGVKTDLETALFDVDHGIRLRHALAVARRAHVDRPSIDGDDVLAWALARNGLCAEAMTWSKHSLRLGTQDALKYFHRGAIERCLGQDGAARAWFQRALALNPHFSVLWAPVALRWSR